MRILNRQTLRRFPVLGSLVDTRWKDHREAISEVLPGLVLATAPIWLGAIWLRITLGARESIFGLLMKNVDSGEFCLYATATLGPLYYLIHKEYAASRKFPSGLSFSMIAVVIGLISSFLFAAQKAPNPDNEFILNLSLILYVAALAIVYLAHVYKNLTETGAAHRARSDTNDMVDEIDNWSGGH